jgi:hypothetical protein
VIEHIVLTRIQLRPSCPESAPFRAVAFGLMPSAPKARGKELRRVRQINPIVSHSESHRSNATGRPCAGDETGTSTNTVRQRRRSPHGERLNGNAIAVFHHDDD